MHCILNLKREEKLVYHYLDSMSCLTNHRRWLNTRNVGNAPRVDLKILNLNLAIVGFSPECQGYVAELVLVVHSLPSDHRSRYWLKDGDKNCLQSICSARQAGKLAMSQFGKVLSEGHIKIKIKLPSWLILHTMSHLILVLDSGSQKLVL